MKLPKFGTAFRSGATLGQALDRPALGLDRDPKQVAAANEHLGNLGTQGNVRGASRDVSWLCAVSMRVAVSVQGITSCNWALSNWQVGHLYPFMNMYLTNFN